MIRLLLVHPSPLLSELIVAALQQQPDMIVVGLVATPREALVLLRESVCDVMLVDIQLSPSEVDNLLEAVTRRSHAPKILMTGLPNVEMTILHYLEAGADGYLLEQDALDDFISKIRSSYHNEFPLPATLTAKLIARLAELKQLALALNGDSARTLNQDAVLTHREWEVLHLLEQGFTNEQIRSCLMIELGTVKNHVHNILEKLGVPDRRQAARLARRLLIDSAHECYSSLATSLVNESVQTQLRLLPIYKPAQPKFFKE